MDDALFVGRLQGVGDLPSDRESVGDRDRSAADHAEDPRRRPAPSRARGRRPPRYEAVDGAMCGWFSAASVVRFSRKASDALGVLVRRAPAGP